MGKEILISIIIPTYCCELTIRSCLNSVSKQTVTNFEVLLIDGGSKDSTIEIARQYKDKFQNLTIISEPDNGIYNAMNKGISLASGKWVYFLGADDEFYRHTTLEEFNNLKGLSKVDVVYGNVFSSRFNGLYDGKFTCSKLLNKNICHQAIFFRKSIFNRTGPFNEKYKAHADWDHNSKWFFSSKYKNLYVDLIFAYYGDGGFSSRGDKEFANDKDFLFLLRGLGKIGWLEYFKLLQAVLDRQIIRFRKKVFI